ncbi:predicted protein [Naegleria gruberi]|uniref:Predicted protein n=1 Tax=Naegleria gruberi TaxID=5762 RepID=D2V4F6_NAEGR|nr:uncharacterized protein NAEGRDRAFT_63708 [Naegleria gruberi]EFC48506.1 predicted protein [Naegleria gruberi]|eukprot:XP_002681250.1 predicted protein [Naegleria gruberi strain NEG-M]
MRNKLLFCLFLFLLVAGQSMQQEATTLPDNVVYPTFYNTSVYAGGNDDGSGYPALNTLVSYAHYTITSAGDIFTYNNYQPIRKISKQTGTVEKFYSHSTSVSCLLYDKSSENLYIVSVVFPQIAIYKLDNVTATTTLLFSKTDSSYGNEGGCSINGNGDIAIRTTTYQQQHKIFIFNMTTLALTQVFGSSSGLFYTNPCYDGSNALSCQLLLTAFSLANDGRIVLYGTGTMSGLWLISDSTIYMKKNDYYYAKDFLQVSNNEFYMLSDSFLYKYNLETNEVTGMSGSISGSDGVLVSDFQVSGGTAIVMDYSDNSITFSLSYSIKKISPQTNTIQTIAGSGKNVPIPIDGLDPKQLSVVDTVATLSKSDEMYFGSLDANFMYKINSLEKSVFLPGAIERIKTIAIDKSLSNDVFYGGIEGSTEFRRSSIAKFNEISKLNAKISTSTNTLLNNTLNPIFGGRYVGLSVYQDEIYIADYKHHTIRKISKDSNMVVIIAGNGTVGFTGDGGLATEATLNNPSHAIVDSNGDLWIADLGNNRVRKVFGINGTITTVSGNGIPSSEVPPNIDVVSPIFLTESPSGDAIYVTDWNLIKKIDKLTNQVSIIAGTGQIYEQNIDMEIPALEANINPLALVVRSENSLDAIYFADPYNQRIRKLYNNTVSSVPGSATDNVGGLEFDTLTGDFYVSTGNYQVRKITPQGQNVLFAGNGTNGFFGDGMRAVDAAIFPTLMLMKGRNLYFSNVDDPTNINNIKYVSVDQENATISTLIGGFGDGLKAENAYFGEVVYMDTDEKGNLYILEGSSRIRKITKSTGIVTTIAGLGNRIESGIPANQALFTAQSFSVVSEDVLLVPDIGNNRIFKISNGIITNIVGNYTRGYPEYNLPANETSVRDVQTILQTPEGEIIITLYGLSALLKLNKYTGKLEELKLDSVPDLYYSYVMRNRKGEFFYTTPKFVNKLTPYCVKGKLNSFKSYCVNECFGIADETKGCSGHGYCLGLDQCSCFAGYNGSKCEDFTCNSILKSQANVCSGHGICSSYNNCTCSLGYYGANCEEFDCFGTLKNSQSVCSGNGQCLDFNNCTCKEGYYGAACDKFDCFGVNSANSSVCSSHGSCPKPNNCSCDNGYYGASCGKFDCNGIGSDQSSVCSSHGTCSKPNNCSCDNGYYGNNCQLFNCFGQLYSDNSVCSGNGTCSKPNNCTCKNGYYGSNCESFNCKGVKSTDASVCSSRGQCIAPETCQCTLKNAFGSNCEFVTTPSTSKNINGHVSGVAARSVRLNVTTGMKSHSSQLLLMLVVFLSAFIVM